MDVIIYHNPACGTSRNVLAMIRNSGVEPHIIEYLKCPPTRLLLTQLLDSRRPDRATDPARERARRFTISALAIRRSPTKRCSTPSGASDPDESAARGDAEGRAPLPPLGSGSRLAAAATRAIRQGRR